MHSRYSDELIEEIRVLNDIVDVVSEYVKLDRKGKNYFGLCPFHREKTPSFSVEPNKQIFYCFSCGKGGGVFQFISQIEKLDFIESVRYLAERARITLPESEDKEEVERQKQRQETLKINLLAARFFHDTLVSGSGEAARNYLTQRGIANNTLKRFGLGLALDKWDGLVEFLSTHGYDEQAIIKSGLATPGKNGAIYDKFRGRIMFPIFDIVGNVIAFGGRVMDSSMPKYMNSPETAVYSKGRNLYALNFAKNSSEKRLIVVEGYMDAISLHQSGITNTVASLGTAMTEAQGRLLKKYAEEIVISYDSDAAGQAATIRGLDLLADLGCKVKVLTVPDGKDPDEFIRKNGSDSFIKAADMALSLIEYKIGVLKRDIDISTTEGRISFLNKVASLLAKLDNNVEREMYVRKFSAEYQISENSMFAEVIKKLKPKSDFAVKKGNQEAVLKAVDGNKRPVIDDFNEKKLLHHERFILSLLCADNSIYKRIKENIKEDMFISDENRRLAGIIFEKLNDGRGIVPAELLNIVSKEDSGEFARILNEECHCDDNLKAIMGKIKGIELLKAEIRKKKILELLSNASSLNEGDVLKLKQEIVDITNTLKKHKSV